ncbi:hypothetical protein [uncultured Microbacterium sp.]|uniref:hypothetical protein n=1 Tax=uncultured Microbacterium sp. TaxID=191216 RepID=UPI0025F4D026|nr:hypothetical protein [uncultured Microbacterium sp.]
MDDHTRAAEAERALLEEEVPDWRKLTPPQLRDLYISEPAIYWFLDRWNRTDPRFKVLRERAMALVTVPEVTGAATGE